MIDHDMATRFANADWTENSAEDFLSRAYLDLKAENEQYQKDRQFWSKAHDEQKERADALKAENEKLKAERIEFIQPMRNLVHDFRYKKLPSAWRSSIIYANINHMEELLRRKGEIKW